LNQAGELLVTFMFFADASEEGDNNPLESGCGILVDGRVLEDQSHSQLHLLRPPENGIRVDRVISFNDLTDSKIP